MALDWLADYHDDNVAIAIIVSPVILYRLVGIGSTLGRKFNGGRSLVNTAQRAILAWLGRRLVAT